MPRALEMRRRVSTLCLGVRTAGAQAARLLRLLTRPPMHRKKQLYDRLRRYETPNAPAAINTYVAPARRHDMDPAQIAFQFMFRRTFVTSVIMGASIMAQRNAMSPQRI